MDADQFCRCFTGAEVHMRQAVADSFASDFFSDQELLLPDHDAPLDLIVKELQQHGIATILTAPENLTVETVNKYLEIKARLAI